MQKARADAQLPPLIVTTDQKAASFPPVAAADELPPLAEVIATAPLTDIERRARLRCKARSRVGRSRGHRQSGTARRPRRARLTPALRLSQPDRSADNRRRSATCHPGGYRLYARSELQPVLKRRSSTFQDWAVSRRHASDSSRVGGQPERPGEAGLGSVPRGTGEHQRIVDGRPCHLAGGRCDAPCLTLAPRRSGNRPRTWKHDGVLITDDLRWARHARMAPAQPASKH